MTNIVKRFGMEIDLSREGKVQCPRCAKRGGDRSHNNLHVYGLDANGDHLGARCFSCDFKIPSVEWLAENEEYEYDDDEKELIMGLPFDKNVYRELRAERSFAGSGYRKISDDIYDFYKVLHGYEGSTLTEQLYPTTKDWKMVGLKRRGLPKSFGGSWGETGKDCEMFGQWLFKQSTARDVLITEGEIDAMSAFQMLKGYNDDRNQKNNSSFEDTPVVSSTIGASGSYLQIQKQYEWLSRFERIILCYDNDEAGQKALEEVAKVLPKGKVYIMQLPVKDVNKMLEDGRQKEFINAFFKAKAHLPSGIVGSKELLDKVIEAVSIEKIPLPPFLHKLQTLMAGGIPLGVVVNLGSMSGAGKSTIADECVYYWIFNSPHKVGVVSLESDSGEYGIKLISRHVGKKINLIPEVDRKLEYLNRPEIQKQSKVLFQNDDQSDRFFLVEERDGSFGDIQRLVEQLVIECGCKVIILDPLQDVLDGMTNEQQSLFMKWQKGMLRSHGISFININHVRKSQQGDKANSTGAELYEEDFQGSSSIFKSAACNILFSRNKEAENLIERNTTRMKVTKCRWTGRTDPCVALLYYDNDTHHMADLDDWLRDNPEATQF